MKVDQFLNFQRVTKKIRGDNSALNTHLCINAGLYWLNFMHERSTAPSVYLLVNIFNQHVCCNVENSRYKSGGVFLNFSILINKR